MDRVRQSEGGDPPIRLLGQPWESKDVRNYADELGGSPDITVIEGTTHVDFRSLGLGISLTESGTIKTIHFYAKGRDPQFQRYAGSLPHDLTMDDDMTSVRGRLGQPARSGGAQMLPVLGLSRPWDRYDFSTYSLHAEYAEDGSSLTLVTLMTRDTAPGRPSAGHRRAL
jgi:hypothetical protein